jgi:Asp-tRNA(Asn)/Glu-tRNA(Gln) amidotransferase C subunit
MDEEKIKQQAKQIIDNFVSALEKIETKEEPVERVNDRRMENTPKETDKDFKKIMFENAPNKKGDCITAEKGKWV